MSEVIKTADSVFADCTDNELDFDVMFDQEDSLIDTVNGVNESGDPLTGVDFPELHQTDDEASVDDVKDELEGDEVTNGVKDAEGTTELEKLDTSVKGELEKESDADKFTKDADDKYQEDKKDPKPDESSVTNTIDKSVSEEVNIDSELDDTVPAAKEPSEVENEKCCKESDEGEEEVDIDSELDDNIIADAENEKCCKEATDFDADVEKESDIENDSETQDIDSVLSDEETDTDIEKLEYDVSDEELIDIVANNDI